MQPLCAPRAGAVHAIPSSRPSPDPPPRAIMAGAKSARSCASCSKRSRGRHMLRRRRDVSSVTGDRAQQDDPTLKADPLCRSIGGLSCSWEWPDTMFADAVDGTIVKGDAPSFLMPRKDDFDSAVVASDMPRPDRDRALSAATMSSDDRERGRSGALFPAKSLQANTALADISNHDRSAEALHSIGAAGASPTTSNRRGDGLFMLRSSERGPR